MSSSVVGACSSGAVLTAWAIHLGASPLLLGTLWAVPYLAQVVQPLAACLTSRLGPKPVAVWASAFGRQMLWALALLPVLASPVARRGMLLACIGAYAVGSVVGNNAWMSWMAVLVPARVRGRYFGSRNARSMLVGTAASLAVGAYLDAGRSNGSIAHALAVTSAVGAAFGVLSSVLMSRQQATPARTSGGVDLRAALAPFAEPGARRVLAFQAVWSASTGIAASLYSAHALGALGLGVTGFALYNTVLSVLRVVSSPLWGRVLDQVGSRPVLIACALFSAFGSALWIATAPGAAWFVAVDAILSGVALGGIDLALFMLPLTRTARIQTPAFVASTSMVAGAAFGIASVLGGALMGASASAASAASSNDAMRALFALSAVGRAAAAVVAWRLHARVERSRGSCYSAS
jgi:MFS family permease